MNKSSMIAIIVVLVVVVIGGLFIANQQSQKAKQSKMAQEKTSMMKEKDDTIMEKSEGDKMVADKNSASRYAEYSKGAYDQAVNNRRVLYFYASWCPICRPADADFKANSSKIPEDVTVLRVNYNDTDTDQEEKDLANKYGITYQHTFVQIDSQNKEVTKWNGGKTDELLTNIK